MGPPRATGALHGQPAQAELPPGPFALSCIPAGRQPGLPSARPTPLASPQGRWGRSKSRQLARDLHHTSPQGFCEPRPGNSASGLHQNLAQARLERLVVSAGLHFPEPSAHSWGAERTWVGFLSGPIGCSAGRRVGLARALPATALRGHTTLVTGGHPWSRGVGESAHLAAPSKPQPASSHKPSIPTS